ncbi:phosphoadenylyl-sulfate reductase [Rummeliibacillus pycnus]|uniref:phosphoadenylyl-sulfate reductase n=1 Tax=Rummeliibacillus pycnus TaxID=101070 RepID=UPI0037CA0209
MLTFETFEEAKIPAIEQDPLYKGALEVLKWSYDTYKDQLVYGCSFGIEGIVLIDLIAKIKPDARIVFLDTNLHFQETYETIQKVKGKYPSLQIEMKQPRLSLMEQESQYGEKLWETNPNECCRIRKIEPLHEELSDATAWISGLRREQSPTRANTEYFNKDSKFEAIKVCPLIYWTWKDVWRYASNQNLPYNVLHDQGYPSIGCEKCTKPAWTVDDLRSGRWQNIGKTECGLHG